MRRTGVITLLVAAVCSAPAAAAVPDVVRISATLQQGGAPADGTFTVVVNLFDQPTDGTVLFTQTEPVLVVVDGDLIIDLGTHIDNLLDASVLEAGPAFLSVVVNGDELTPRLPLRSTAFARHAGLVADADRLQGLSADDVAKLTTAGGGLERTGPALALAASGVQTASFAAGAVGGVKVAADSVSAGKVADGAVGTDAIADGSVGGAQVEDDSISTNQVAPGSVSGTEIGANLINGAQLAAATITARELAPNSVDGSKVKNGSVTAAKFATASKIRVFRFNSQCTATSELTTTDKCITCGSQHANCDPSSSCFSCPNTQVGFLVR